MEIKYEQLFPPFWLHVLLFQKQMTVRADLTFNCLNHQLMMTSYSIAFQDKSEGLS